MYINVKYNLYYKKFEGNSGFNDFNFVNIICLRVAEATEACAAHIYKKKPCSHKNLILL